MTDPKHLAVTIRNAYDGRDREQLERAIAEMLLMTPAERALSGLACTRHGGCVCGGDTPGVRADCFHAIKKWT